MIKFSWCVGVSCSVVGFFVSSALAQNPTLKLVPLNAASVQRCLGGPEEGELCGTTSNCERDDQGQIHPECVRVCATGVDQGQPCSTPSDCSQGSACNQQCFCNRWITDVPLFLSAQIRGLNWSPDAQRLLAFQASVDFEPACNAIAPFKWERPCSSADDVNCFTNDDCGVLYPICGPFGVCQGANHAPQEASFICPPAPSTCPIDYVFLGRSELPATDTSSLVFRYGSTLLTPPGIPYSSEKYFGTLTLSPRPTGCGTVSIGLQSPTSSNFFDENSLSIGPLDLEGLTFVMPTCVCKEIQNIVSAAIPERCSIDARQGSEPDSSAPAGWTTAVVQLDCENAAGVEAGDFTIREFPGNPIGNPTTVVTDVPEQGWVTLTFPDTQAGVWTCIKFKNDDAGEVCLGGLPGDSNLSGTVEPSDVTVLIDCIAGATCTPQQCDMDRSDVCGVSDLVRQIDLMGGAQDYDSWLGTSLDSCPNPD
jgi:hypothetical protein